jgi:hypothetical protein
MARPHGHPLDPEHPGPVLYGIATLQTRGRLELPAEVVAGLKWIGAPHSQAEALATLAESGRVVLSPWLSDGKKVIDRRLALLADIEKKNDPNAMRALRLLEQKYRRTVIDSELRITCSPGMLLDLRILQHKAAYVWRSNDKIELVSVDFHDQRINAGDPLIDDLP